MMPRSLKHRAIPTIGCAIAVIAATLAAWLVHGTTWAADEAASGKRGPGLKAVDLDAIPLPVPRTAQLTHVHVPYFVTAMADDPHRIFHFVRDHVAYEVYSGSLRGPRGTLLALSGNSIDRAALSAEMLKAAGFQVRFARGTLSEKDARELVESMWVAVPHRTVEDKSAAPGLQDSARLLTAAIEQDYATIRDHLEKAKDLPDADPGPDIQSLVDHVRDHTWVQMNRDGVWQDFDPTFADASPDAAFAKAEETFESIPPEWMHHVVIRMMVEEFSILESGNTPVTPKTREILRFESPAAQLAGYTTMLAHQPEKWSGPSESLGSAISAAVEETGRVKPVLLLNDRDPIWRTGEPFQQKLLTGGGIGRIGSLLGGAGSRKPVPVTTAAWIEVDFLSPDGETVSARRDIFDVIGLARRAESAGYTAQEVRERTGKASNVSMTTHLISLFFTTGGIHPLHLQDLVVAKDPDDRLGSNVIAAMTQMHVTFASIADAIFRHVTARDGTEIRFYAHTPRLHVVDSARDNKTVYMGFDVRHDRPVAIARHKPSPVVHRARVMRGIVVATLERIVMEHFLATTENASEKISVASASTLFEMARHDKTPTMLLTGDRDISAEGEPSDTQARLQKELADGYLAIAPARAIPLNGTPRYAWWRIDPRTGDTVGVTDDGLHGTTATEKPTITSTLKIIYVKTLNIYVVEFVIAQSGLAGTVYCNVARIDPPADFVRALSFAAQNVVRLTIP